jgi:hypothetical protein
LRTPWHTLTLPCMLAPAALGFRLHTGWAAVVVVAGAPGKLEVPLRRRTELLPPGNSIPRFVYHKAAELPSHQAAELVRQAEIASRKIANIAIKEILDHIRSLNLVVKSAGIPCGSRQVPKDLSTVLGSHPMIHTAEGTLFQQAMTTACKANGLAVVTTREREVWSNAAAAWGMNELELHKQIDRLRKSIGAPWGGDQKTAAAFAVLALR